MLQAMAQPIVAHYGSYWIGFHWEVVDPLKQVFQIRNDLFIVSLGTDLVGLAGLKERTGEHSV
jgi:hypothetical protein